MNRSESGKLGYLVAKEKLLQHNQQRRQESRKRWEGKKCKYCGEPIPYAKRRTTFCNHTCSALFNNLGANKQGTRPEYHTKCSFCRKPISRKTRLGHGFCNSQCMANFSYTNYIRKWKEGQESGSTQQGISSYVKRYLFEKHQEACTECGWNEHHPITGKVPLEIHHKDGNYLNNEESNLVLLCPNCHSLTANYRGLNRGNGREKRRISQAMGASPIAGSRR